MQELNGIMHQTCDGALSSDGALLKAQCLSLYQCLAYLSVAVFLIFEYDTVRDFFDKGQINIRHQTGVAALALADWPPNIGASGTPPKALNLTIFCTGVEM